MDNPTGTVTPKERKKKVTIDINIEDRSPDKDKWEGKLYRLHDGVNYDKYLEELGVGPVLRKISNTTRPIVALRKKTKDKYVLINASDFLTTILEFELCKPFTEETIDGRKMRTTMSMYNNVLIQHQIGERSSTIVREFHADKMIAKFMVNDVEAIRVYKAIDTDLCRQMWEENKTPQAKKKRPWYRTGCCM